MSSYSNMKLHLERRIYLRGMFKGDAPVAQRGKSHFRVVMAPRYRDEMYVRFHNADLITAYPDGRFVLNTNGWSGHSTTKAAMREAAWMFTALQVRIHNKMVFSKKQEVVTVSGKTYLYYDGMEFSADGALLSPAKPFEMRRINRDEVKEYTQAIKDSGFKAMFPVLYATCTQEQSRLGLSSYSEAIPTRDYKAHDWPILIAKHKYDGNWKERVRDMKTTWSSLMKDAKVSMYDTLPSTVTVL
jgi:hypothetical protein